MALVLAGAFAIAVIVGVLAATGSGHSPARAVTIPVSDRNASPALFRAAEAVGFTPPSLAGGGQIESSAISSTTNGDASGLLPLGAAAPPFLLRTPTGTLVSLAGLRGKTVLLEFFATWCPHCAAEAPHLKQIYAGLPRRQYAVVAVNADGEDAASVLAYHIYFGFPFPAVLDPSSHPGSFHQPGSPGPVSSGYRVGLFPTFYIVDSHGRIAWRAHGEQPDALLLRELRRAG
jgi:thiol-disulfide isomerase/thioredoxin